MKLKMFTIITLACTVAVGVIAVVSETTPQVPVKEFIEIAIGGRHLTLPAVYALEYHKGKQPADLEGGHEEFAFAFQVQSLRPINDVSDYEEGTAHYDIATVHVAPSHVNSSMSDEFIEMIFREKDRNRIDSIISRHNYLESKSAQITLAYLQELNEFIISSCENRNGTCYIHMHYDNNYHVIMSDWGRHVKWAESAAKKWI